VPVGLGWDGCTVPGPAVVPTAGGGWEGSWRREVTLGTLEVDDMIELSGIELEHHGSYLYSVVIRVMS